MGVPPEIMHDEGHGLFLLSSSFGGAFSNVYRGRESTLHFSLLDSRVEVVFTRGCNLWRKYPILPGFSNNRHLQYREV